MTHGTYFITVLARDNVNLIESFIRDKVAPLVIGVPGAVWWRASSRAEANEHYARAVAEGRVTILT